MPIPAGLQVLAHVVLPVSSGTAVAATKPAMRLDNARRWYERAVTAEAARKWYEHAYVVAEIARNEQAAAAAQAARVARARRVAQAPVEAPPVEPQAPPPTAPATDFGNLDGVVQCIKAHESGNYSESSHVNAGSGAYQFIPGTWRAWSARAGYPGYAFAYQAPPAVQDAVLHYTLTHGGAGNWSNRFGNDPCTQGMGG